MTGVGPEPGATRAGDAERLARVALAQLAEPGDQRISSLAEELGAVALAEHLAESRDPGLGTSVDVAERLAALDPERELDRAARLGIRFVVPGDEEWPTQVESLATTEPVPPHGGTPLGLWVRGPLRLDQLTRSVAVVGSRSATTYGGEVAAEIGSTLGYAGWTTISGAAFGIDHAAHRGALTARGATVAVLACGVDRPYPAAHRNLLEHLAAECAVVSELPPGWAPTRLRFLARNRLIAALARGSVIVEAASRSGALNTANWTGRLHRPVMGVPGPVTSAQSEGVHDLVRTGAATLVTCGDHVLEVVGESGEHLVRAPRGREVPRDRLTHRQQQVLDAVPVSTPVLADSVARTAGMGLVEVRSNLGQLEKAGFVVLTSRGWRLTHRTDG